MDHSIMTIARAKSLAYARKVDQHQQRTKGRSTSLALSTALASCADEPCGKLSLNEMAMVFNHRAMDVDAIATIDKDTLFRIWIAVDTELQLRKEALENESVPLVEDVPAHTPFASCVGVDDADHEELEAFAVRSIHAEVLDMEEEFS